MRHAVVAEKGDVDVVVDGGQPQWVAQKSRKEPFVVDDGVVEEQLNEVQDDEGWIECV